MTPDVSIVVPVYDEAENLPELMADLGRLLAAQPGTRFEVLFVDDGSTDGSLDVLRGLARGRPEVRLLHHLRNCGQSAALLSGFAAARAAIVVTMDADLQNDPADVPRLLAELVDCDLVSGVRVTRRDSWLRRISSRVANAARRAVLHDGVSDVGCSLKAYRAELLTELPAFNGLHRFLPALVKARGGRIRELPVAHRPRRHGASKYGVHNRLWRGIADLWGVRWLARRSVAGRRVEEIEP
ncbi:MAG: glycosyltransferase family 2 protein [Thermoanaerobaculia bacterium]